MKVIYHLKPWSIKNCFYRLRKMKVISKYSLETIIIEHIEIIIIKYIEKYIINHTRAIFSNITNTNYYHLMLSIINLSLTYMALKRKVRRA